jgi:hypothetical protein
VHPDVASVEQSVVAALARGEPLHPHALLFLLRLYQATGRDDVADLVGRSLALVFIALDDESPASQELSPGSTDRSETSSTVTCAVWLELLVDTSTLTEDVRVSGAIVKRICQLRQAWTSGSVEDATAAIGACLHAARLDAHRSLIPEAIDRLELIVSRAYRPGEGIGTFGDHVRAASALLTAYSLTGRLPYSMLAEELMVILRRFRAVPATAAPGAPALGATAAVATPTIPVPGSGTIRHDPSAMTRTPFLTSCEAARVLCRLAALHDNLDYRRRAIIAPDADYRSEAARVLDALADDLAPHGIPSDLPSAAIYGVARLELDFQAP